MYSWVCPSCKDMSFSAFDFRIHKTMLCTKCGLVFKNPFFKEKHDKAHSVINHVDRSYRGIPN